MRKKEADTERSKGKGYSILMAFRCLVASVPVIHLCPWPSCSLAVQPFPGIHTPKVLPLLKLIQVRLLLVESKSPNQY